ncbi:MAG: MFS transporter, partial [Sciscionella sp.]|nr:MFS transporter [Sciscionella sp.]
LGGLAVVGGTLVGVTAGDTMSFVLAALLVASTAGRVVDAVTDGGHASMCQEFVDGLRVVGRSAPLRATFVSVAFGALAQGLFVVLFVVFVARVLHGDATEIGLLRGVQAIGGIVGGALLGVLGRRISAGPLMVVGALTLGVLELLMWNGPLLMTTEGVYLGLFIAIGIPAIGYSTGLTSALQRYAPKSHLGRVFSAFFAVYGCMQAAGMLLAGIVGDKVNIGIVLNGQAMLYVLAGCAVLISSRYFRGERELNGANVGIAPK